MVASHASGMAGSRVCLVKKFNSFFFIELLAVSFLLILPHLCCLHTAVAASEMKQHSDEFFGDFDALPGKGVTVYLTRAHYAWRCGVEMFEIRPSAFPVCPKSWAVSNQVTCVPL